MRLALGTAQFGQAYGVANQEGQVSCNEIKSIINFCKNIDINTIDTAINYGNSEKLLGEIGVNDFQVITKIPSIPDSCPNIRSWLSDQVELSLNRLNLSSLYGIMLHKPEQLFGSQGSELLQSLIDQKELGKVQKLGVSIYDPYELTNILSIYHFGIIQCPFNLVDRRLVTTGWLDKLKKEDIEIHTRSCFLQGLLAMPRGDLPEKFNKWEGLWDQWHNWLNDNSFSAIEACLNFIKSYDAIDKVVVGVDNLNQLEQIVEANRKKNHQEFFPDISSDDIDLINPSNWSAL